MIVALIAFLFILISILRTRISILEEAIKELRAKGCLDTTDKHTPIHTAPSAIHFSDGSVTKIYMSKDQKDT